LTPILVQLDQDADFLLEIDVSGYTTGTVLSQFCDNSKWHSIVFTINSLTETKSTYAIHDKELLLVIQGLEEWNHILEGAKHKMEILNVNRNLMYFQTSQNLNCWQVHWYLYLSFFNTSLIHRPG